MRMEYPRYGRFRFSDYFSAWIGIVFLLVIGIVGVCLDINIFLCLYAIALAVFMLLSILIPNKECFTISDDIIKIKQGRKKREVTIPIEATLVISYADVCPPLAKRVSFGNQTYMLKGKYAVSILYKMSLEKALECLHQNYAQKYTTSTIEASFDEWSYIYSFVCNQALLDQLLIKGNYQLIIPESLLERVSINQNTASVYVDAGY